MNQYKPTKEEELLMKKYYDVNLMGYIQPPLTSWKMKDIPQPTESLKKVFLDEKSGSYELYNILSKEECDHYIKETEKLGYEQCYGYDPNYRSNTRVIIKDLELSKMVFDRIKDQVPDTVYYNNKTWKLCGLNEVFRFCRYEPKQHFNPHQDAFFQRNLKERSFYTFMIYLNGGFEGGSTRFLKDRESKKVLYECIPSPGMALIFPHELLHDGERLKSNLKYIWRSDLMYKMVEK